MRGAIPVIAVALLAVSCGGGGGRPGGTVVGAGAVTLDDVQAVVFTPNCAVGGCHTGPGAPFGLDLSAGQSLANLVGVPSAEVPGYLRVEPYDSANSYLFMKVSADSRIQGDPMPAFRPPLSSLQQQLISDWIDQGAQP